MPTTWTGSRRPSRADVAALTLLRQLAFAYLTCNGDAHAKNFSIQRLTSGEWRVTPAYDLPSTYPYGDTTLALSLNDRTREDIGRGDFVALARGVGVRPEPVERTLTELCDRVDRWIDDLDRLPFDRRTIHELRRAIEYRRGRLRVESQPFRVPRGRVEGRLRGPSGLGGPCDPRGRDEPRRHRVALDRRRG